MVLESTSLKEQRDPLLGRVVHDRYRVVKRIGKGGMGVVYLAEHVLIGRKVALKTLSDRAFASDEMVARFHREAVAAAAVGNQHVVDVTDMGRLRDGTYYIVMEYLDGVDLGYAMASEGPWSIERAIQVVGQLCDALSAVHRAGIVHRDLKPENVFLVGEGRDFVKVLDFGICKLAASDRPLTKTGAALGTPQFMAPEQLESSARVDARADIYAVGALLYFLLAGEEPFAAPSLPQLFLRVSMEPAPSLSERRPDIPSPLCQVVRRTLQKRPEQRFATAAELKQALQSALRGSEPVGVSPVTVVRRRPRVQVEARAHESAALRVPTKRWPLRVAALTVCIVGVVVAALAARSSDRDSDVGGTVEQRSDAVAKPAGSGVGRPQQAEMDPPARSVGVEAEAARVEGETAPRPAERRRAARDRRQRSGLPQPSRSSVESAPSGAAPKPPSTRVDDDDEQPLREPVYTIPRRGLRRVF